MKFKIKIIIAKWIDNHYPNACWTELVSWANGTTKFSEIDFSGKCQRPPDFDKEIGCYCGKNKVK
jgi:hypothetical protein